MWPALQVGGVVILWERILLALAVIVSVALAPRWLERIGGIDRRRAWRVILVLAVAAFAGGHGHYVLNYARWFASDSMTVLLPWNGLHAPGAIIGLALASPVAALWARAHPGRMLDGLVPTIGVGAAIARLGCFLNGCCYGVRCGWAWCVSYPPSTTVQDLHVALGVVKPGAWSLPVHPIALYFAGAGILITATALWLAPRKRYHGQVALVGLLLFGASSFGIELLRQTTAKRILFGTVPQLEVIAGALTAVAAAGLLACELGHRVLVRVRPRSVLA